MNKNNWKGRTMAHRKGIFGQEIKVYNASSDEGNRLYDKATGKWIANVFLVGMFTLLAGLGLFMSL